jgi:hypothetical protein
MTEKREIELKLKNNQIIKALCEKKEEKYGYGKTYEVFEDCVIVGEICQIKKQNNATPTK